jgi:hypothetical protein
LVKHIIEVEHIIETNPAAEDIQIHKATVLSILLSTSEHSGPDMTDPKWVSPLVLPAQEEEQQPYHENSARRSGAYQDQCPFAQLCSFLRFTVLMSEFHKLHFVCQKLQ